MSNTFISLIFAAGAGLVVYSIVGKRLGYSNTGRVWSVVLAVAIFAYIVVYLTITTFHLH